MNDREKKAVYPGSFDPIHRGHCDIIERAARIFDTVIVTVSDNQVKRHSIDSQRRVQLAVAATGHLSNVVVEELKTGLIADFCSEHQAEVIIKGLRQQYDVIYELPMATVNYDMKQVETIFLGTRPELSQISSTIIRQLCEFGGDITPYVPEGLAATIAEYLS